MMKKKHTFRNKFIRFLAKIYVFFKVVNSKGKYRKFFLGFLFVLVVAIAIPIGLNEHSKPKQSKSAQEHNSVSTAEDYTPTADVSDYVDDASVADWFSLIDVDFDTLQETNSDVIGWIYFENEDISYPILYSGDDDYYLYRNLLQEEDNSGSIFLEGMNSSNLNDRHSLIYGHNMKNLTMFGKLKYYKNTGYYEYHQYFQIIIKRPDTGTIVKYRYHIFAYKDVSVDDDIYHVLSFNYAGLGAFTTDFILNNNYLDSDVVDEVTDDDYVITLSTCSSSDDRFVVSAKRCAQCVLED